MKTITPKLRIKKNIPTEYGNVSSISEIAHTDNGQVTIHITSIMGDATIEQDATVGTVGKASNVVRVVPDPAGKQITVKTPNGHEHRVTIGAVDGNDKVSSMTEAAVAG